MPGLTNEDRADIEAENLICLLEKYGIDPAGDKKWLKLSLALARDKVKGFSDDLLKHKNIGRPTKQVNALTKLLPKKAKKRGRPKTPKLDLNDLKIHIDEIKVAHNLFGHGSDKKAIEILVANNFQIGRRNEVIKKLQKLLSEARQKIPQNTDKPDQ